MHKNNAAAKSGYSRNFGGINMAYASDESYEEMISALNTYLGTIGEQCNVMSAAAQDCVDNTDEDPAAAKSASRLNQNVARINEAAQSIQKIAQALAQELEDIHEQARKAMQD